MKMRTNFGDIAFRPLQGESDAVKIQEKNSRNGGKSSKQAYFNETKVLIPDIVSIPRWIFPNRIYVRVEIL